MSLALSVLGSGSGGNSTVLVVGSGSSRRVMLIDAGFSPRMTNNRLANLGIQVSDVSDVFLTHLDTDHFYSGWLKPIEKYNIRVHVHRRHRHAAFRAGLKLDHMSLFGEDGVMDDGVAVEHVMLPHDERGSVGYIIEYKGTRLAYATDVGRITDDLFDLARDVHALAIESNYDRQMQLDSDRPWFLKQRIMGGRGHLSNEQSLEAVQEIATNSKLSHLVLLHLSRQCNEPQLVHDLYKARSPKLHKRLTITNQFDPTPLLQLHRRGLVVPTNQKSHVSTPGLTLFP